MAACLTLNQLTDRGGARAVAAPTPSPPSAPSAIPTQRRRSRSLDISSDTDTTVELVEGARPGHLMAFHEMSTRNREKRLRQAKRELCQMQLKVRRLEKLASKCKTPEWSASEPEHDSLMLESDDDTCSGPVSVPVGMSTPQPSCSTEQRSICMLNVQVYIGLTLPISCYIKNMNYDFFQPQLFLLLTQSFDCHRQPLSGILGQQVLPLLASCLGKQAGPYVTQSMCPSSRFMTGVVFRIHIASFINIAFLLRSLSITFDPPSL